MSNFNKPRPTTGHWIGDQPVLPEHIPKSLPLLQRAILHEYLTGTNVNLQHNDTATLIKRANAHFKWSGHEQNIIDNVGRELGDEHSAHFKFSHQMIHQMRPMLAKRGDSVRSDDERKKPPEGQEHIEQNPQLRALVDHVTKTKPQGAGDAYTELATMLIRGQQGPLSREQAGLGMAANLVGNMAMNDTTHLVAGPLDTDLQKKAFAAIKDEREKVYQKRYPRVDSERKKEKKGNDMVRGHPSFSPHGVDLSTDPGSVARDRDGLPVMMGTSGTSSDAARFYRYTFDTTPGGAPPTADNVRHLTGLAFHYLRTGPVVQAVNQQIRAHHETQNLTKIGTPPASATQTHTYGEVDGGIRETLGQIARLKTPKSKL